MKILGKANGKSLQQCFCQALPLIITQILYNLILSIIIRNNYSYSTLKMSSLYVTKIKSMSEDWRAFFKAKLVI